MSLTKPDVKLEIMLALCEDGQIMWQFTGLEGPVEPMVLHRVLVAVANSVAARCNEESAPLVDALTTEAQPHLLPEVVAA